MIQDKLLAYVSKVFELLDHLGPKLISFYNDHYVVPNLDLAVFELMLNGEKVNLTVGKNSHFLFLEYANKHFNSNVIYSLKSGDHSFNLGSLPEPLIDEARGLTDYLIKSLK